PVFYPLDRFLTNGPLESFAVRQARLLYPVVPVSSREDKERRREARAIRMPPLRRRGTPFGVPLLCKLRPQPLLTRAAGCRRAAGRAGTRSPDGPARRPSRTERLFLPLRRAVSR